MGDLQHYECVGCREIKCHMLGSVWIGNCNGYQYASGDIRMTWEGESYYPLDGGSNMAEMQILHGK